MEEYIEDDLTFGREERMTEAKALVGDTKPFMANVRELGLMIKQNEIDPLKAMVAIRKIELAIKTLKEDPEVKEAVDYAFDYSGGREMTLGGVEIKRAYVGTQYDYHSCQDPVWNDLNDEITRLREIQKARERFLRTLPEEGLESADPITGEWSKLCPPLKKSEPSLKFTILDKRGYYADDFNNDKTE